MGGKFAFIHAARAAYRVKLQGEMLLHRKHVINLLIASKTVVSRRKQTFRFAECQQDRFESITV